MSGLSIVTATFRDPEGLRRTLRSLMPLEGLGLVREQLVVDSSPEWSEKVLEAHSPPWPVRHLIEPARGIYAAVNSGISASEGRYLWLLHGGDTLRDPPLLAEMIRRLDEDASLDLVCAGAELHRDGERLYPRLPSFTFAASLWGANRLCHQGIVYRRVALGRVGPFSTEYLIASDYHHHLRCLAAGCRALCIRRPLVDFELGGASDDHRRSMAECRQVARSLRRELPRPFYLSHLVALEAEAARVRLVKAVAQSPFSPLLRPLWLSLNRGVRRLL
ncbi:MAG: glycosyltransferase [Myxococcales bacterium]|nr:glycosyltransferase [Myxococcales bacterium]